MTITVRTITHTFTNADGTPASGCVVFGLLSRMTNDGQTILPGEVTGNLDGAGDLSVSLAANDDTDTSPSGASWQCTVKILGTTSPVYNVTVPSAGSGAVDLGSLLPGEAQIN